MAVAPLPTPNYIDWENNVKPYIGRDKVLVSDANLNAVPLSLANQLIAQAEAFVLEDLSTYFITVPALITTSGGDWTTLPPQTYDIIYYMFVSQAAAKLIGNFIARNTDQEGTTLSYFQNFYEKEYARYLNRIMEHVKNGGYRYQLLGLAPNPLGIKRQYKTYALGGDLGANNYTDSQLTDASKNFDIFWGVNRYY